MLGVHKSPNPSVRDWEKNGCFIALPAIVASLVLVEKILAALSGLMRLLESHWAPILAQPLIWAALLIFVTLIVVVILNWRSNQRCLINAYSEPLYIHGSYLRGRREDLDLLLSALRETSLLFIIGDPGIGKSLLLKGEEKNGELGLQSILEGGDTYLTMYIDSYGEGWVEKFGLKLQERLGDALTNVSEIQDSAQPMDIECLLQRLADVTNRTPVLIFDQLNEYQTITHCDDSLHDKGPPPTAEEMVAHNPFWADISALLNEFKIKVLFSVQTWMDQGGCLSPFYFIERPGRHTLGRLEKGYVYRLLSEVTSNMVAAPDRGWQELKQRIVDDLADQGGVHPTQMEFAFRGLSKIESGLSLNLYIRNGGLANLILIEVNRRLDKVANKVKDFGSDEIYKLVSALPADSIDVFKTQSGIDRERLAEVLKELRRLHIVRKIIISPSDGDRSGRWIWCLYHDFLRAPLELRRSREVSRWKSILSEGMKAFHEHSSFVGRWHSLLRPGDQIGIFMARCRREIKYGSSWGYAWISILKLLFNAGALAASLAVVLLFSMMPSIEQRASILSDSFIAIKKISRDESDALWKLSQSSQSVKKEFIGMMLSQEAGTKRFLEKSDYIAQALFGLNIVNRTRFLLDLVEIHCYQEGMAISEELLDGCSFLLQQILGDRAVEKDVDIVANDILRMIKVTKHSGQLKALARGMGALREEFQNVDVDTAASHIVAVASRTKRVDDLLNLVGGLILLKERSDKHDEALSKRLVNLMHETEDMNRLSSIIQGLQALGSEREGSRAFLRVLSILVSNESRVQPGGDLIAEIQKQRRLSTFLVDFLGEVSKYIESTSKQSQSAVNTIIKNMDKAMDPDSLKAWARVLGSMDLEYDDAYRGCDRIVHVMRDNNPLYLPMLSEALRYLSENEDSRCINKAAEILVEALEDSQQQLDQAVLPLHGLGIISNYLDRQLVDDLLDNAARIAEATHQVDQLPNFLRALSEFDIESSDYIKRISIRVLDAIVESNDSDNLVSMVEWLRVLWGDLPDGDADMERATRYVMEMIDDVRQPEDLSNLARGLGALGGYISDDGAKQKAEGIASAIAQANSSDEVAAFAKILKALGGRLDDYSAKKVLETLLRRIRSLPDPPCAAASTLIRKGNLEPVIDLLKWPTCSKKDRRIIMKKVADAGNLVDQQTGAEFFIDLKRFIEWAKAEGYKPELPPELP